MEEWVKIQRWYRKAEEHLSPPIREVLEHTLTLRGSIYIQRPP